MDLAGLRGLGLLPLVEFAFMVVAPVVITGLSWCRYTFCVTMVVLCPTRSAMVSMDTPLSLAGQPCCDVAR